MGSDDAVIKGVEEKIKNHLINGTEFKDETSQQNDVISQYEDHEIQSEIKETQREQQTGNIRGNEK